MKSVVLISFVLVLFAVGWAVLGLFVVRSLLILARIDSRLATAAAVAVAGAFFLGSTGPLALSALPIVHPSAAAPAASQPPVAVVAVDCSAASTPGPTKGVGFIDHLAVVGAKHAVRVDGWGATASGPGAGVCLLVDGRTYPATARYGISRPDVATAMKVDADRLSGFSVSAQLPPGRHVVGIGVVEGDGHTIDALAASQPVATQ